MAFATIQSPEKTSRIRIAAHPLGEGVGGKGVGLQTLERFVHAGFFNDILTGMSMDSHFRRARDLLYPFIPGTCLLTSGHFLSFLRIGDVRDAVRSGEYFQIKEAILRTAITDEQTLSAVTGFALESQGCLAVRSSTSCEDNSRKSPFAGDFATTFVANDQKLSVAHRVEAILEAIKYVYASMFASGAMQKMKRLGLDPTEHYMALVIQEMVGDTFTVKMRGTPISLVVHMPEISIVLASSSAGVERPAGVLRNAPYARVGFGLGTLHDDDIPCTLIFPDRPRFLAVPHGISISESDGNGFVVSEFRDTPQDRFDALDMSAGAIRRISFGDIDDVMFFLGFRDDLSFLINGDIYHGVIASMDEINSGGNVIRATFASFVKSPLGRLIIEFFGRAARKLRDECGFDVDVELALRRGGDGMHISLLQLRPYGMFRSESVVLSSIPQQQIIAEGTDCIGHGRVELDYIILVTGDVAQDISIAQGVISNLDSVYAGRYLIIGPNIKTQRQTGIYANLHDPGVILRYNDAGVSVSRPGTHMFTNTAMMRILETTHEALEPAITRILNSGVQKICNGIFLLEQKVIGEFDGETGQAQVYFSTTGENDGAKK